MPKSWQVWFPVAEFGFQSFIVVGVTSRGYFAYEASLARSKGLLARNTGAATNRTEDGRPPGLLAKRTSGESQRVRSQTKDFYSASFARYVSGSAVIVASQPLQHRNTSLPLTVTLYGLPIAPSGSPLTGQSFCL